MKTDQAAQETKRPLEEKDWIVLLSTVVRLAGGQVRLSIDEMEETFKGDKSFQVIMEPEGFLLLEVRDNEVPAKL